MKLFSNNNRIVKRHFYWNLWIFYRHNHCGHNTCMCQYITNHGRVHSIWRSFNHVLYNANILVLCHAFSFSNVTRGFANTGHCPPISPMYIDVALFVIMIIYKLCKKLNSGTYRFLEVSFLHGLMRKLVEYQYVVNLNCCVSILQKSKNIISQIISPLWKGCNNKIRFQTKDDVIVKLVEPYGSVLNREGLSNLKGAYSL